MTQSVSLLLVDELSIILIWIGAWGLSDMITRVPFIEKNKNYFYLLLILIGIYNKV